MVCITAQANCALALNGVSTTYDACATLQGEPSPYRLYYTYDSAASTITGAFAYPNPTGWVAWGVNTAAPGQMLGGSALVVKSNASAPSGEAVCNRVLQLSSRPHQRQKGQSDSASCK